MQSPPAAAGSNRSWSWWGAFALAGLLPLVDLGVVALVEPVPGLVAAVGLVLLVVPLHLWLVAHALRGVRAPGAGWCLAALAVLTLLAMALVQTTWSFLFSTLAVSFLLGLPARWSVLGLGAVLSLALADGAMSFDSDASSGVSLHVVLAIGFRAVCLVVVVRLVAQVDRLDGARARVAAHAVEHERASTALELTTSLGPALDRIGVRGSSLTTHRKSDALAAEVAGLAGDCRRALAGVRHIVACTRDHASRRALADAGRLLRGDAGTPAPAPARPVLRGPGESTRRALGLFVVVRLGLLAMLLFLASGVGTDARPPSWLFGAAVAVAALELPLALRTALAAPSAPPSRAGVLAASGVAATSLGAVYLLRDPSPFLLSLAFVTSAAVMVLPPRGRLAVAVGTLVLLGLLGQQGLPELPPSPRQLTFLLGYLLGYLPVVHLLAVGSLVASAHLVRTVIGLDRTRTEVVEDAVDSERRRFARDLHDTLVQRLSAIALTADLVQRLLVRDPAAATAELAGLVDLTDGLAEQALQAGQDRRGVTLADEARSAVLLLRAAGVRTDVRLQAAPHAPEVDALLGWALREAATNVVRHSVATRCSIVVSADREATAMVITNDGAGAVPAGPTTGNGLAGMDERVRVLSGSVSADLDGPGRFRLRVSVPVRT